MTAKRKKAVRRRTIKKGKLPNWSLLVLGLAIGLMLAWVIQFTIKQSKNPGSGLSRVLKKANKALSSDKPQKPKQAVKTKPTKKQKTKFHFYDMLAENESLLPDTGSSPVNRPDDHKVEKNVSYTLQVAALGNYADADKLRAKLTLTSGLVARIEKINLKGKGTFYRVRLGPYKTLAKLNTVNAKLKQLGYQARRIKIKLDDGA